MRVEHLLYTAPEDIARNGQGLRCYTDAYYFGDPADGGSPTPACELLSEWELARVKARLRQAYRRVCWRYRIRRVFTRARGVGRA